MCTSTVQCVALLGAFCTTRGCVPLQFRSISNALYGSERHHSLVRDTVVRYMAANKAEFEPYLGEDWCVSSLVDKCLCCGGRLQPCRMSQTGSSGSP